MKRKRIAVLGSTGSIGVTTLDLAARFEDRFEVTALAAGRNTARLAQQIERFRPSLVGVIDDAAARELRQQAPDFHGTLVVGDEGLKTVAATSDAELVVAGLVGALGLVPTLAALRAGKDVALANKEALVVAGQLMTEAAQAGGARLLPIDSEHNAVFQALRGHRKEDVARVILTASGGPFLNWRREDLATVSREQALNHPTWKMGDKITIDCATLMNKGLEVIEARWLFDLPPKQIAVLVHPQSIVHSMVEYIDGSVLAQMGIPDMAIPISYILAYPERLALDHLPRLSLAAEKDLQFRAPDFDQFPCLRLAYAALEQGGTAPAVLNGANEIAVQAFLDGGIRFTDIHAIVASVLDQATISVPQSLDELLDADRWARDRATHHTVRDPAATTHA